MSLMQLDMSAYIYLSISVKSYLTSKFYPVCTVQLHVSIHYKTQIKSNCNISEDRYILKYEFTNTPEFIHILHLHKSMA
jgi:hypothetical protein